MATPTPASNGGNGLRYVACLSYPRSGHHLTQRVLEAYFQDDFKYCSYYNPGGQSCCHAFPCADPTVKMTKNHDLGLEHPKGTGIAKVAGVPHLIMVRNYLEAVVSDYTLYLKTHPDTPDGWRFFSRTRAGFYGRFVRKWALDREPVDRLVVRYEDLTAAPLEQFSRIVEFFRPPLPPDRQRLQRVIDEASMEAREPTSVVYVPNSGVRSSRRLEDFRHFDARHFSRLEAMVAGELGQLGYALRYHRPGLASAAVGWCARIGEALKDRIAAR